MGLVSKKNTTSAGRRFGINVIYGAVDGKTAPYMYRAWIGRLRFHLFCRGDEDPDCHDHPWGFWTFPLRSYVEEYLEERTATRYRAGARPDGTAEPYQRTYYIRHQRVVKAFRLHRRDASFKHRVLGVHSGWAIRMPPDPTTILYRYEGYVPTIVWRDRPHGRLWGFYKERLGVWCRVQWQEYVCCGGKHGPCE